MSQRLQICDRGCQVCRLHYALSASGASHRDSNVLRETECSLVLKLPASVLCITSFKMDIETAKYRRKPSSKDNDRMCDFAVALAIDGSVRFGAIELKSREPYLEEAAEQLKMGLLALVSHADSGIHNPELRAILVVGIKSPRLMQLARTRQGRLVIDGRTIQIELVDCHSAIAI